jgi:hypothetical protein
MSTERAIVIKDHNIFLLMNPDGSVPIDQAHGLGPTTTIVAALTDTKSELAGRNLTVSPLRLRKRAPKLRFAVSVRTLKSLSSER